MPLDALVATLVDRVTPVPKRHKRRLIAVAGPPASGKSTLAAELACALPRACVVPMDGFHLDNRVLTARGLLSRKGAPETFDIAGFTTMIARLQDEKEVVYPVFDRSIECAIAGAAVVDETTETVVVEGNYLLLDAPGWRTLRPLWDFAAYLDVPEDELRARLMQRWHDHGYAPEDAHRKVETNDLPNAATTRAHMMKPDLMLKQD
jgi:pantothenate kinase